MISSTRDMKAVGRTIMRGLRGTLALAVIASGGTHIACEESCECGSIRTIGQVYGIPQIPQTATAGVPVEISFRTVGGGCYFGGDPLANTEVEYGREGGGSWVAVVTPYDLVMETLVTGDGASCCSNCTDIQRMFEHKVNVVFRDPGTARIMVAHRAERIGPPDDPTKVFVYAVEVSPAG